MKRILVLTCLALCLNIVYSQESVSTLTPARDLVMQRLEAQVAALSRISGGVVGISAIHLETAKRFTQNGQLYFPMASSFKVPIAIELLTKVDSGLYSLDQLIEIKKSDMHPGSGMISERFNWPNSTGPGLALSVRSLLELMLLISDNSAADMCMQLAGGAQAVNNCMKRLGIEGIRLDRPTSIMIAELRGLNMDAKMPWDQAEFDTLSKNITPDGRRSSFKKFDEDLQDNSTPDAMSDLLLKLYTQPILKQASKDLLLDIMKRCETGSMRLKGLLPEGTEVLHKTGTIGLSTNDVGIMTLPGDGGHVVIAVFIKSSWKTSRENERAIAEVTRTIYDYFVLNR